MTDTTIGILERQEGESDKAWLAFVCYRDLGSQRSVQAAYIKYIEAVKPSTAKKSQSTTPKSQSPASEGFKKWVVQFNWSERVRNHDAEREGLIRESLLKTDREKYLDSIENFRLKLESGGLDSMSASTIIASRLAKEAAAAAVESGDNRMTERDLDSCERIMKILKDATGNISAAREILNSAYALDIITDKLQEKDD
jgi:hypothetical protein